MDTLEQLLEARKRIDAEIASRKSEAVDKIKADMERFGVSVKDLGNAAPVSAHVGAKRPVKYRDNQGNTWTGVGQRPRWIRAAISAGADLEQFRIKS